MKRMRTMNWRTAVALAIVIIFGFSIFYYSTDGFSAFTAETARVKALMVERPYFPEVTFVDSKERVYTPAEFKDKYVLITFMYTSCTTVCVELEHNMAEVYAAIPPQHIGEDMMFLSISFDPERDTPATLEKYRGYFNSDGETWRMATIADQSELDALLRAFGVIVIPDDYGHFAHNSAFYLIDGQGQLIDVMDYKKPAEAAERVVSILRGTEGER